MYSNNIFCIKRDLDNLQFGKIFLKNDIERVTLIEGVPIHFCLFTREVVLNGGIGHGA